MTKLKSAMAAIFHTFVYQ